MGIILFLRSTLFVEKAPYVFTLFIAAISWIGVQSSSRIRSTPFIEYSFKAIEKHEEHHFLNDEATPRSTRYAILQMRNISNKAYPCFVIHFVENTFSKALPENYRIIYLSTVAPKIQLNPESRIDVQWDISDFSTTSNVALLAPIDGAKLPSLKIRKCEKKDADLPALLKPSLSTWYVEHELEVLWSGAVLWLAILILFSFVNKPTPEKTTPRKVKIKSKDR